MLKELDWLAQEISLSSPPVPRSVLEIGHVPNYKRDFGFPSCPGIGINTDSLTIGTASLQLRYHPPFLSSALPSAQYEAEEWILQRSCLNRAVGDSCWPWTSLLPCPDWISTTQPTGTHRTYLSCDFYYPRKMDPAEASSLPLLPWETGLKVAPSLS